MQCSPRGVEVSPHTRETTTGQEAASSSGRVEVMDNQVTPSHSAVHTAFCWPSPEVQNPRNVCSCTEFESDRAVAHL